MIMRVTKTTIWTHNVTLLVVLPTFWYSGSKVKV